jgi:hypothetical protein
MSHRLLGLLAVFALLLLLAGNAQAQLRTISEDSDLSRASRLMPIWDDDEDDDDDDEDIDEAISGAWLAQGSFDVDLGCDGVFDIGPLPFSDAHTFGVGGDHVATNPSNPNSNLGTWIQTGARQITARDVSFAVDATPGGTVTTIAVISLVVDFDEEFETATTTFAAKVYLPFQDPLDPAEMPVACSLGYHDSFRKVSATE